jgi:hypothetical protein
MVGSSPSAAAETYTYASLARRLMDLERLAVLPADGETCQQWSSYDRASRYDVASGKYVAWDANGDGGQFIRQEGETHVMAEMQGPGCIWRIWSATAEQGHVKIYLDGQQEPAVDLPFQEYFTGKSRPFAYPGLSYQLADVGSRGHNLYVPIPYQKSCKVVAEKGWGAYYHIVYSTFPAGTQVPTFRSDLPPEGIAALEQVNSLFTTQLGQDPAEQRAGEQTIADTAVIPAGSSQRLDITGSRAVTAIRGSVECEDRDDEAAALRQLRLSITFDDHQQPSVWTPLGDFFGTAPGKNLYRSLPTGVTANGSYAYWYMPFAKRATIELKNDGSVDRTIRFEIVHAPLARSFAGLGHFCARWHRDLAPVPEDRFPDWRMLQATGRGRFCGVMLHVWNPKGGWWGEGDEKFFVDGEKFPSTIGTGSEDYFGYAWCHPGLFQFAYHCQTKTENNRGHQSVLRWHITDNIPFQKSFEACIEKYYPNSVGTLYACLPCYYLDPAQDVSLDPVPVEQRHGYYVKLPPGGAGFLAIGEPPGTVEEQGMAGFAPGQWKDDNQLWWTGAKPGDKLHLRLLVEQDGTYAVAACMTKAIDYGIVQLWIDGKKTGPPVDLFHEGVVPTGPVALGTHQLAAGDHTLTVEIVGANPQAVPAYMFGLDQVLLHRQ